MYIQFVFKNSVPYSDWINFHFLSKQKTMKKWCFVLNRFSWRFSEKEWRFYISNYNFLESCIHFKYLKGSKKEVSRCQMFVQDTSRQNLNILYTTTPLHGWQYSTSYPPYCSIHPPCFLFLYLIFIKEANSWFPARVLAAAIQCHHPWSCCPQTTSPFFPWTGCTQGFESNWKALALEGRLSFPGSTPDYPACLPSVPICSPARRERSPVILASDPSSEYRPFGLFHLNLSLLIVQKLLILDDGSWEQWYDMD